MYQTIQYPQQQKAGMINSYTQPQLAPNQSVLTSLTSQQKVGTPIRGSSGSGRRKIIQSHQQLKKNVSHRDGTPKGINQIPREQPTMENRIKSSRNSQRQT